MPELPEVETIRRQLSTSIVGLTITGVRASWEKSLTGQGISPTAAIHQEVVEVSRRGKVLLVHLSGDVSILVHLRMTGQLLLDPGRQGEGPLTRAVLSLSEGQLVFNDQRKFGRLVVMATSRIGDDALLARMGPEPLSEAFTVEGLRQAIGRHRTASIKAVLLDQSTVAGLGNIYVDEVLFVAGIHPATPCAALTKSRITKIAEAIRIVLTLAIARGGSTMRDYRDATGAHGTYLDVAHVFGRTGQPCRACGSQIVKERVAGRGTHVCRSCQPRRPNRTAKTPKATLPECRG